MGGLIEEIRQKMSPAPRPGFTPYRVLSTKYTVKRHPRHSTHPPHRSVPFANTELFAAPPPFAYNVAQPRLLPLKPGIRPLVAAAEQAEQSAKGSHHGQRRTTAHHPSRAALPIHAATAFAAYGDLLNSIRS